MSKIRLFKRKGENKMENTNQALGYVVEYYNREELKEQITRNDLTSDDQDRKDWVQSFIVGLMEPWSASAESFDVRRNIRYDGTKVDENEAWKATYISIFYDFMESRLIAYGATPADALKNVEKLLEEMGYIYEERYADEDNGDNDVE
jgi:hypothetical protein